MSKPYPTNAETKALFRNLETDNNNNAVFSRVSPEVDWTVMGTHPLAGRYTTLEDFYKSTIARLSATMKDNRIGMKVRNVIGGGEGEWATVELVADAVCKNGERLINSESTDRKERLLIWGFVQV